MSFVKDVRLLQSERARHGAHMNPYERHTLVGKIKNYRETYTAGALADLKEALQADLNQVRAKKEIRAKVMSESLGRARSEELASEKAIAKQRFDEAFAVKNLSPQELEASVWAIIDEARASGSFARMLAVDEAAAGLPTRVPSGHEAQIGLNNLEQEAARHRTELLLTPELKAAEKWEVWALQLVATRLKDLKSFGDASGSTTVSMEMERLAEGIRASGLEVPAGTGSTETDAARIDRIRSGGTYSTFKEPTK